jgi:pilus assembly protein FimV
MNFSPARWAAAMVAAALIVLPGSALAQTMPPQNPPQNPPSQPPGQTQPAAAPSQNGQADPAIAKQHLTEARDALAQLTSMPEASKLQGDTRNQVSELISNFNAMITAPTDWRASYAKVNESLTALIGPDTDPGTAGTTGTAGAPGTTGTTGTAAKPDPASPAGAAPQGAAAQLDPAIRAKLVEFRTHLKEFEKAAGGGSSRTSGSGGTAGATGTTGTTGTAEATGTSGTTAATGATGASDAAAASGSTSASGSASASNPPNPSNPPTNPPGGSSPAASAPAGATGAAGAASAGGSAEQTVNAKSELAAIDAILADAKTGGLTKEQTAELRRHVDALRALLIQK